MKDTNMKVLSDEDLEFAYALRDLDVDWRVALLITYLANVEGATSRDIENGAGLSQPEVSIAMRTLRYNNWVEERAVKRGEGKGRPAKIYALNPPIDEIIRQYGDKKMQESERAMETIQKLKVLSR